MVDFEIAVLALSALALSALVYLMYRSAVKEEWKGISKSEKSKWQF